MPKLEHEPLDEILKVFGSPDFSKKERQRLFEWVLKETNLGRKKRNPFKGWIPVVVSVIINVIISLINWL